jgi:hypothetical protein
LVSLQSEHAVDLDRDGNFLSDIIAETRTLTEPTFFKNNDNFYVQLKSEAQIWPDRPIFYDQQINLRIPLTYVIVDDQNNFLYTDYAFANLVATYKFSKNTNQITVSNGNSRNGIILSAAINESLLTITFKQFYYTTDWEELTIIGSYKKRK